MFVEPGPLPPHERTWRHPSELGPTRLDVDDTDRRSTAHLLALAGGTLAALAVATMVVAMTPHTSDGPTALSATTTPGAVTTARTVVDDRTPPATSQATQIAQAQSRSILLTSFAAFPHAVTPGPQFDLDGTQVASGPPHDDEMVFLRTDAVTYHVQWDDAQTLPAPDGSVVFDSDGDLVALVIDGDLLSVVDD